MVLTDFEHHLMSLNPTPSRFFKRVRFNSVKRGRITKPFLAPAMESSLARGICKECGCYQKHTAGCLLALAIQEFHASDNLS
jgi:hypothetical protein